MRSVLLSLRPAYADRLLSGHKTAEIRRRFPSLPAGTALYVYASSPRRAVLGKLVLEGVHLGPAARLWKEFGTRLDITKSTFDDYIQGARTPAVLEVSAPARLRDPISLGQLRSLSGLEPSQSYRYLSAEICEKLERMGGVD